MGLEAGEEVRGGVGEEGEGGGVDCVGWSGGVCWVGCGCEWGGMKVVEDVRGEGGVDWRGAVGN